MIGGCLAIGLAAEVINSFVAEGVNKETGIRNVVKVGVNEARVVADESCSLGGKLLMNSRNYFIDLSC